MIEHVAALLVVVGIGSGATMTPPPTVTLHRFENAELCQATAMIIAERIRSSGAGRVSAFCIPAEPLPRPVR